ncbi:hypothetical protein CIPAW_03G236800 [Carya illinoinensis]|uniref:Uncharacterized protein n=1 Tax=Carya illinoinensis TaxID=32201 RepID=A0A8T1R4L9_CARIL|nr:hypothetical protein CIPAW_03G236800 [Carya illinoinensis]
MRMFGFQMQIGRGRMLFPSCMIANLNGIFLQQSCFLSNFQVFSNVVPTFVQQCRRCLSYKIAGNHGPI